MKDEMRIVVASDVPSRPAGAVTRRGFVARVATAAIVVTVGTGRPRRLLAAVLDPTRYARLGRGRPETPIEFSIDRFGVHLSGSAGRAVGVNESVPGPLLRLREGENAVIRVTNHLDEPTSVHWHGLLVPTGMDGVPGFSFPGIAPGETFTYRFPVRQRGTYWYHSHSGGQEQQGLYGPIVIDPADDDPIVADRDHVVMLSDWTDEDPARILAHLKMDSDYYNYHRPTLPGLFRRLLDAATGADRKAVVANRAQWATMRMERSDISDVSGYTFLLNGQSAAKNWTGLFRAGERVRLRLINGSAMTYFDVRIPGLEMVVVQADGQDVEPVTVDQIRIAVAETYDVIVQPRGGTAYTIFAQAMDRTGYARGTLAEQVGVSAPVPPMDPRPVRTMADMGMGAMAGMDMKGSSQMPGMDMPAAGASPPTMGHAPLPIDLTSAGLPETPGWRTLMYRELRARTTNADIRPPTRDVELRLTGDMQRYFWTINGLKLSEAPPIRLQHGERVRLRFVNETMMDHPMHLHGMFTELQTGTDPARAPRKHTISIPPGTTIESHFTALETGVWAFHCHLLYHMMTGMMTRVVIDPPGAATSALPAEVR
ncbi:MAG TPA: copper resistance system multicopper oxidase [Gemmatimonadaceae bacterium]|nr:copper resistance system multicopper oxidase [Gemmatimonadaceae bacterium]